MKTSNIILSTLIGSITFIIVTASMQVRLTGEKNSPYVEQVYATINLSEFKYLIIRESVNLHITTGDEVQIVIHNAAGQDKPQVRYHESGDTLYIDHIKPGPKDRTLFVTLKTQVENLEWISAGNAAFSLTDFPSTHLNIDLDNSRLSIHSKNQLSVGKIKIAGVNNSHVNAYDIQIDTLDLHLDQSEARIRAKINKLKGAMINNSLSANDVSEFEFRKDSTSRMQ